MKNGILKHLLSIALIGIAILLTTKFIMWNSWKLDRAAALAKGIYNAPHAVNLTLSRDGNLLFEKGFAHDSLYNSYVTNQFDITPYLATGNTTQSTLEFSIGRQPLASPLVYRFKAFNIVAATLHEELFYFIFTTPACGIEEFVRLNRFLPFITGYLARPPLYPY